MTVVAFLALLVVSCGGQSPSPTQVSPSISVPTPQGESAFDAPDPQSFPEVVAPAGLGGISLPATVDEIASLFDRIPEKLVGRERTPQLDASAPGVVKASYGNTGPVGCGTVGFRAQDVSTGDFFPPGWTAERVIAVFTTGADWDVEDFGRDESLFWVRWNTTCGSVGTSGSDSLFFISWAVGGSPWMFSAAAGDAQGRDELVAAFVSGAR